MGLRLTLSALALVGASWLFGSVAEDVVTGDRLTALDVLVADWLHAHATPVLTGFLTVVTHAHDPTAILGFTVVAAAFLLARRDGYWLAALIVVVPVGMLVNVMMKHAFHRMRPHFDDPLLVLTTFSFPSGHVAGATLLYGVLAAYLYGRVTEWRPRLVIALLALASVVTVAFSRLYLGVHYLSDVVAAFAEGLAWLILCLTALTMGRHAVTRR